MKTKIIAFVSYLTKNFLTGAIIMLGAVAALMGVQAFQQLSTTPSDAWNQSLSSPILSKVWGVFERDTMSLQAISESLGIKKTPKIMFITSQTYTGNLWWLAGADQLCQWLADAAGSHPNAKWKRWLALLWDNNIPIKARIPFLHSEITDVLWNTIFTNNASINYFLRPEYWYPATFNDNGNNSILIDKDEQGNTQANKMVWTWANALWDIYRYNTSVANNCYSWTYGANSASASYTYSYWYNHQTNSSRWLYYTTDTWWNCANLYHLYCLEI